MHLDAAMSTYIYTDTIINRSGSTVVRYPKAPGCSVLSAARATRGLRVSNKMNDGQAI